MQSHRIHQTATPHSAEASTARGHLEGRRERQVFTWGRHHFVNHQTNPPTLTGQDQLMDGVVQRARSEFNLLRGGKDAVLAKTGSTPGNWWKSQGAARNQALGVPEPGWPAQGSRPLIHLMQSCPQP